MKTDLQLKQGAIEELRWEPSVTAVGIGVEVSGGVVRLLGRSNGNTSAAPLKTPSVICWASQASATRSGIKPTISQAAVKSDIEDALKRSAASEAKKIAVEVQGSSVTLSGSVHNWSERDTARQSAWRTPGVTHVTDNIAASYH